MAESNQIPQMRPNHTKLKRRKPSKNVILAVFWVIILIIVGFGSFTLARNSALAANRPAEKALAALKANDPDGLYNLGTDEFKKTSDKTKVKAVVTEWTKVINQATDGKPQIVSKQTAIKDGKELTTLDYKYQVQPGKSKINQKELFVRIVTQKVDNTYKLYTINIDTTANQKQ